MTLSNHPWVKIMIVVVRIHTSQGMDWQGCAENKKQRCDKESGQVTASDSAPAGQRTTIEASAVHRQGWLVPRDWSRRTWGSRY